MFAKAVLVLGLTAIVGTWAQHSQTVVHHDYQPPHHQSPHSLNVHVPQHRPHHQPAHHSAHSSQSISTSHQPSSHRPHYAPVGHHHEEEEYGHPAYEYHYSVSDHEHGDEHGQSETRDGDHTHGEYYLVQPDGQVRKVTYSVDGHSGFVADVSYSHGAGPHH